MTACQTAFWPQYFWKYEPTQLPALKRKAGCGTIKGNTERKGADGEGGGPSANAEHERRQSLRGIRHRPYRASEDAAPPHHPPPHHPPKTANLLHPDMPQRCTVANTENGTHDWKWIGGTAETQIPDGGRGLFHFVGDWGWIDSRAGCASLRGRIATSI